HPHAVEGFARCSVDAELHRLHTETSKPLAVGGRQIVYVGLDLELRVACADVLDHFEEMRMEHRLTARERQIRHLERQKLIEDPEQRGFVELAAKSLAGAAFLDAMQAREIALVRDLPCDVERCREIFGSLG